MTASVFKQIEGRVDVAVDDLGIRPLKNIAKPTHVYGVNFDRPKGVLAESQTIKFCAAADGTNLAYALVGQGPPIVMGASWLTHLEYDWRSPVSRHYLTFLSQDRRLVRYDQRGNGLSDWDVGDLSFEAFVSDMETVLDAIGVESFPIFAMSQAASVSIAYS